jgi:hypothetical protein
MQRFWARVPRGLVSRVALAAILSLSGLAIRPETARAQAELSPGQPGSGLSRNLTLTGTLTGADHQTYVEVPFDVPPGVERLTLEFEYDRADRTVIDLGLYDPQGLRGWSGGNKSTVTVATSDATPSYVPGPIIPGQWRLLLGVPNIRQSVTARWTARISLDDVNAPPPPSAFLAGPIGSGPAWYRGDLHTHSGQSDGSCDSLTGNRVPCPVFRTLERARAAGLDFVAVTEHNTPSGFAELRGLQAYYDNLLILPGREITTFYGHMNAIGPTGPLPFQLGSPRLPTLSGLLDAVEAQGGILSINHPGMPSGEACMGCGWVVPETDCTRITAVEVANGGTMRLTGSVEGSLSHIPFWEDLLNQGCRITAIAGSDSHDPDAPLERQFPVGRPATVVYAADLSQAAILDGIRSGRVFIDLGGRPGPSVDLSARSGDTTVPMGSVLTVTSDQDVVLTVSVSGVPGGRVELVSGGSRSTDPDMSSALDDQETLTFTLDDAEDLGWVRINVREVDGALILISNPIYFHKTK